MRRTAGRRRLRRQTGLRIGLCLQASAVPLTDDETLDRLHDLVVQVSVVKDDTLPLGALLDELEAWLQDDRQWHRGGHQHWRSLLDDVVSAIGAVVRLTAGVDQEALAELQGRIRRLKVAFKKEEGAEEVVRRQLVRVATDLRSQVTADSLIESAWRRAIEWARSGKHDAAAAVQAIHDLAAMRGQDAKHTFDRLKAVLADSGPEIAYLRGESRPEDLYAPAGTDATERLELAVSVVRGPAEQATGVVWLEFLQAHLWYPYTLELGPVTLYEAGYLRSLLAGASDDARLPADLLGKGSGALDTIWFGAHESAVHSDEEPNSVYVRLELSAMPRTRLLSEARSIAEFLAAYASLRAGHDAGWVLGESHLVRGWIQTSSAETLNADAWRLEENRDTTAYYLACRSAALGTHIPFPGNRLREAGNLLVWQRRAAANDSRAQIVFHDRVIEQVCGWAGLSNPERFVSEWLKPTWVYSRLWNDVFATCLNTTDRLPDTARDIVNRIRVGHERPPHAPPNFRSAVNLKIFLEELDDLVRLSASSPLRQLIALQTKLASRTAMDQWITDLENSFDRKTAVLRRTRNSLVHGGPFTPRTVEYASDIAIGLSSHALRPAVDFMLDDQDPVDAFLDRRDTMLKTATDLRRGVPAAKALFSRAE